MCYLHIYIYIFIYIYIHIHIYINLLKRQWGNRGVIDITQHHPDITSMVLCRGDIPTGVASILQLKLGVYKVMKQIIILFPALKCTPEAEKKDHRSSKHTYIKPIYCVPHTLCINSNTQNSKRSYWFYFPDLLKRIEILAYNFTAIEWWCQDSNVGLSHSKNYVPFTAPYSLFLRNKLMTEDIEAKDFENQA